MKHKSQRHVTLVKCPYCGVENWIDLEYFHSGKQSGIVLNCNWDDVQGCDKDFVVYPVLSVTATTAKIESE